MMWITRRLSAETKCSSRSAGEAEYVTVRINKIDPGWAARAPAPNKRHEHTNFKETKSKATPAQPNTRSPTNTRLFQWSTQKSSYASRLTPRAPVLLWRNSGAIKTRIWTNSFRSVKLYVTQAPQRAHGWVWNSRKEQELLSAYLCFVLRFSFIWGNRAGNSRRRSVPSPADVVPSAALCCANKKFFRAWNCESIFFFFVFPLCGGGERRGGGGEERRGDTIFADVLKIRSQTRDRTWLFGVRRRHFLVAFFIPCKLFPANSEFLLTGARMDSWAHVSRPLSAVSAGQRKPRRLVTFNPCKPCPPYSLCSVCRNTSLHHLASYIHINYHSVSLFATGIQTNNPESLRALTEPGAISYAVGTRCSRLTCLLPWLNFNPLSHTAPPPPQLPILT